MGLKNLFIAQTKYVIICIGQNLSGEENVKKRAAEYR